MPFTVAIVGRPNVGKSTLFNRLLGRRAALVDDRPGVTRDRREGLARVHDLDIKLIDTAGLEEVFDQSLEGRMRKQTERAVADADLVLLLVDARSGLTPLDEHFARWLRRSPTPVALVANKCESRRSEAGLAESYGLGLGEPIPISAEHGEGMADLYRLFVETMERAETATAAPDVEEEPRETEPEDQGGPLQLAIVGRPNVGKSTLVNKLLGEERMLTGPEAGITRDAIAVEWQHRGRPFRLIDTAGLRRRAKVADKLEKLSAMDSMRAVNFAQVVVLLVDAENPLEKQDLTIARTVVDEGRALVIAINKWDACQDRQSAMRLVVDRVQRSLPQSRGIAVVPLSALRDRNFDRLLDAVLRAYDVWTKRVPTAQLNRWLETATASHPPPAVNGRRVRLKYIAQIKSRPPTFAIFCSRPSALPRSYLRYLENGLRESFDLPGTPIRLTFRKGKNPYGPAADARA